MSIMEARDPSSFSKQLTNDQNKSKRRYEDETRSTKSFSKKRRKKFYVNYENERSVGDVDATRDSSIKNCIGYYEHILRQLRKGIDSDVKDEFICNVLQESEGTEIELSCRALTSHCLELLLIECEDISILLRFMTAFAGNKIPAFTNANASHITELLIHHAIKAIQNWLAVMNSEESKENMFVTYCINWITEFGNFVLENLNDCLNSSYSCHVTCTLIGALCGDLTENREFMSKNFKMHKQEFQFQFSEVHSSKNTQEQSCIILEKIPKIFSDVLKNFYKSVVKSESLIYYINHSSSATVIEALIFALKKRIPKSLKKMINKIAQRLFLEKNKDDVPLSLLHKNASFVFDEMFKVADEDLQLELWNQYISDHMRSLVVHPVGNFVVQRLYDTIKGRSLFEIVCKRSWCLFDEIVKVKNFGIFVSMAKACVRLGVQQSFFMENIMQCLQCFEPIDRQDLVIPLLLGFEKYENYNCTKKSAKTNLTVCLQGSLVVQAILKFQKPMKAVKSLLSMSPEDIEFLAGHAQGCHVLNAFFGSITVGDKNKEKLLHHLQPVIVNIACGRNESLTLSRIWTCLSLKLKEVIARYLVQHENTLKSCKSGYAICQKFGIARLRKLPEWRQMQSSISCNKKPQKHSF